MDHFTLIYRISIVESDRLVLFSQPEPNILLLDMWAQSAPTSVLYNQISGCIFAWILNYFPHHPISPLCCLSAGKASSMTPSGTFLSQTSPSKRQKSLKPLPIPQAPDEELDAIKIKISSLRSETQRERVQNILGNFSLKFSWWWYNL